MPQVMEKRELASNLSGLQDEAEKLRQQLLLDEAPQSRTGVSAEYARRL